MRRSEEMRIEIWEKMKEVKESVNSGELIRLFISYKFSSFYLTEKAEEEALMSKSDCSKDLLASRFPPIVYFSSDCLPYRLAQRFWVQS